MNNFQRALKHKNSSAIDEKIARLDEMMTTTGLYSVVDQQPGVNEVPPTFSDAPLGDFADLDDFEWDSDAQGDGSTVNHDLSQLQTTDVEGNTQRIFDIPDIPVQEDGSKYSGTPFAMALSDSTALTGISLGYINENGYNHVYQLGNVFGVSYSDFANKFAEAYNDGTFTRKTIYLWADIDCLLGTCRAGAAYYPSNLSNTSTPKATRALYAYTLLIPTENGNIKRNQVKTDIGVRAKGPFVRGVISRDDLGDPNYYPGEVEVAGITPLVLEEMLMELHKGALHPGDRQRIYDALDKWAKPGSPNRMKLKNMGIPLV